MISAVSESDFILQSLDLDSPNIQRGKRGYILMIKASWCPHCTSFIPKLESFGVQLPQFQFLTLESTQNESLLRHWENLVAPAFQPKGFPTLVLYGSDSNPVKIIKNRFQLDKEL